MGKQKLHCFIPLSNIHMISSTFRHSPIFSSFRRAINTKHRRTHYILLTLLSAEYTFLPCYSVSFGLLLSLFRRPFLVEYQLPTIANR